SALTLGITISPLFQQLGIYDEFVARSKPFSGTHVFSEKLRHEFFMHCGWLVSAGYKSGCRERIIARSELYDLLWNQIPQGHIILDKKIVNSEYDVEGVTVKCGTLYHGDILVGADGAHSTIRQNLYRSLQAKGELPPSDGMPLPFTCVALVGQTKVLDPEEYPDLVEQECQFKSVLGTQNMCT
ncbi:hypothetical protein BGZ94_006133, partial [Podila epigama]